MEATADQLLTKLEQALVKLDAAQGSSVKLQKAEYDFLTAVEKFRDFITQVVQDTSDRDRRSFQSIFGGDCMRIAKGRAVIEASKTKLSERTAEPAFKGGWHRDRAKSDLMGGLSGYGGV